MSFEAVWPKASALERHCDHSHLASPFNSHFKNKNLYMCSNKYCEIYT